MAGGWWRVGEQFTQLQRFKRIGGQSKQVNRKVGYSNAPTLCSVSLCAVLQEALRAKKGAKQTTCD